MIVRVRTFVAIRHWVLNYFLDDFIFDHGLRVDFCDLLNDFVDEISHDASCRKVQLKILAELKKCWRRVCAEHWDDPPFDKTLGPDAPIAPGPLSGSGNGAGLGPGHWERWRTGPSRPDFIKPPPRLSIKATSYNTALPKADLVGDSVVLANRPGTPENRIGQRASQDNVPGSPLSLASLDVVSCSFPGKATEASASNTAHVVNAHPVATPVANGLGQVATTPKALVGKRVRPTQTHKRNNSISDSLREHGSDKSSAHEQDLSAAWTTAGSLVRGQRLPPGQAFVDYEPHGPNGSSNRLTTVFQPENRTLTEDRPVGGAMSGHGMRKLLGSVRRALRTRGQGLTPWHGNLMSISPAGSSETTTNRPPGTAVVPQDAPKPNGGRPPVRIDLLGAEVAEDFKKAIREEELVAEADRSGLAVPPNSAPPFGRTADYSTAHVELRTFASPPQNQKPRPVSDMGITTGSKSIIIVDDTLSLALTTPTPFQGKATTGNFGADPTPPNTPSASTAKVTASRPSSHFPQQHVIGGKASRLEAPPQPVPDPTAPEEGMPGRTPRDLSRPSSSMAPRRMKHPPLSGGTFRLKREYQSSGVPRSLDSIIHNSMAAPRLTTNSYDALSSHSGSMSAWRDCFDVPEPAPLRVLRRRPGGDLRAAASVEDSERVSVRRSLSVGSLATYTESFRSSYLLNTRPNTAVRSDSVASYTHDGRQPVSSFDQLAARATAAHLSDLGTEPPKPVMRSSFEKEAQMLAQIPDDEDDGGIESALLKLEGKYEREKKPVLPAALESSSTIQTVGLRDDNCGNGNFATQAREKRNGGHVHILDEAARVTALSEVRVLAQQAEARTPTETRPVHRFKSFLSEGSHDSYYSTPLLERGLSDASRSKTPTWEWIDRSILRGSEDDDDSPIEHRRGPDSIEDDGRDISFDVIRRSKSIEGLQADRSTPSAVGIRSAENIGTDVTDLSSEHCPENVDPYTVDALFCEQEPMPAAVTGTDTGRGTKATHLSATIPDARPTTSGRGAQTRARRESVLPTTESSPATRQHSRY